MKVLIINGSPKKERGTTAGLLKHFVEGIEEAGASVETIYSKGYDLGDCRGCFNCWSSTPGKCIQDDEMKEILVKIADADLLVLATPVFVDGENIMPNINSVLEHMKEFCNEIHSGK